MDLWDVVKLMVRRWKIALPLLVLTAAGAVSAALFIKPDYTATSNMALLPPSVQRNLGQGGGTTLVNPWTTDSLTAAVVVKLRSLELADELEAQGYKGTWEVDRDPTFYSVVITKVTAPTREAAKATATKLVELAQEEVRRLQADYPLKPGEEITTRLLDSGSVEATSTKLKRSLVVVLGVGLILTMALTIGLDSWLRRRDALRRATRPAGSPVRATSAPAAAPPPAAATQDVAALRTALIAHTAQPLPVTSEGSMLIRPRVGSVEYASANAAANGATQSNGTADESGQNEPSGQDRHQDVKPLDRDDSGEATIVLPLTNAPWRTRSGRRSPK